MKKYLAGTDYEMVPPMLYAIFHKTATYYTPQDMLQMFPHMVAVGASLEKETLEKRSSRFTDQTRGRQDKEECQLS